MKAFVLKHYLRDTYNKEEDGSKFNWTNGGHSEAVEWKNVLDMSQTLDLFKTKYCDMKICSHIVYLVPYSASMDHVSLYAQ